MELDGKNVIPSHRTGKGKRVLGAAGDKLCHIRDHVIAVDEIKAAAVRNAPPERMFAHLMHIVPPHVRHLETTAVRRLHAIGRKTAYLPRQYGEPRHTAALLTAIEQHLQTDADTEERLGSRRFQQRRT